MSHPHQVYGAGVGGGGGSYQQQQQQPSQQSQVHHALSSAAAGQQQQQQQQQFLGAQMSNVFTPQQYEVWQQYYSQIGGVQQQQQQSVAALPQQQQQTHPFLSHSVQSMAQPSVPASSLAMLQQQQQQSQMLVQQQQHHQQQLQHYGGIVGAGTSSMGAAVMPPASPMVVSPSAGLAAASLVQQQYLQQAALLAQQHHQQQQQQQYLLQQQQQRQIAVVQPQQQQQLLQTGAVTGAPAAGTAAVSFMAPLQNVHQSVSLPQHHHQPQQQQQHQQQLIQSHVPPNNTQNQLATAALQPVQQQKQHEKWDPIKEFGLQKDEMALKSPPSNTVAENTRLLKRREEEAAAGRQAYEASESQRVQEELQQQRASAKDAAHALQQRVNSFPEPIHLAGCHTLSKVSKFLPLPVELSSTATALPCFDLQQANQVLANTDESLADYLSTLLSDTTDELRKIELKHGEEESGDLDGIAPVPPMAQTIQAMNSFAFSVDPLDDEQEAMAQAFQNDIQEAVERMNSDAGMAAMAVAMFEAQQQGNHDELFMGTSGSSQQQAQHQLQHNRSAIASADGGVGGHNIQQQLQSSEQEEEMRRRRQQIVSIGKPGIGGRRKKDMVESLYDSLTGYFDPGSKEKRKRGRKRYNSDGEELEEDMDAAGSPTASNDRCSEEPTDSAAEGGVDVSATRDPKSRKRARIEDADKTETKVAKLATNRPTTPTEVIQQRELEWNERQRQREEKYKRRRQQQNSATDGGAPVMDAWTVDIVAEQESFCKFTALVDQVLEQMDEALGGTALSSNMHGDEAAAGLLLDRALLDELRVEAQKLKSWQKLCDVSTDRLVKLLTILEKNIRDVLTENGALSVLVGVKANEEDEMDETLKELIDERVLRSVDASLVALCIMTSKKMPKQLLMEDIIERSVQLSKQCLHDIIYPARDPTLKSMHAGSKSLSSSARKSAFAIEQLNTSIGGRKTAAKNTMVNQLYTRMVDLFTCFSELASAHNLNETLLVQLNSLGCPPFFVDNVPELQMQSIKLLPTIFAKCPTQRKALLFDLINSLHRLPPSRSMRNTYRLSATEHIGNFTVLILQLIQSTVQLPTRKHHHHHHHGGGGVGTEGRRSRRSSTEGGDDLTDRLVLDSYEEAKRMAAYFLGGFLGKCTARSEDDYRRIFEQFLQDILIALYRPLWPVTELILTVLGNLLVMHFRSKNYDLSLRVASMDYLGVIAARLRKDRVHALSVDASAKEKQRLNAIVRCILFDEHQQHSYDPTTTSSSSTVGGRSVDDIDISHLSSSEKVRKLEQALFDYIIWTTWEGDVSMEYVLLFYAVEWYRETVLDVEIVKERYQKAMAQGNAISQKERQKFEQKLTRILEKGASMKTFITALMDKQHLKRRIQVLAKTGNVMVDSDALWVVKYLASKKELSQSFDLYLKKILEGFNPDLYPVAIRAKAMKCLAQIVEADYQVLMISEVNKIVQDRLIDANASVREATFDLIGKCLVSRPELLDTYYSILINRTKDTAVAVRKRVIRILRDIVFSRQDYAHRAQILVELLQRVNDEEGVRKLCLESFQQLWFQPVNMRTEEQKLREKLILMVETAKCCVTDGSIEYFETMICAIAKQQRVGTGQDSAAIFQASKQIVDALVDYVLELEKMVAQEQKKIVAGVTSEEETASTTTTPTTTAAAAAMPLSSQGQMAPPEDAQEVVNRTKHFQSHLFASLTLLSHFARARPEMLIRHIEVFVPYLTIAESSGLEFRVLNQIITMLEQIIPLMDAYSVAPMLIRQLDTRLNEIGRDGGMLLIASSISCMSALYEKFQPQEQPGICRLFMVYFKYLDKLKRELDQAQQQQQQRADANTAGGAPYELSADKKPMLLRALYSTGLMCRHFDFDALLNDTQRAQLALACGVHTTSNGTASSSNDATPVVNSNNVVRTAVFSLLFHHSRSADHAISQKALIALGQLSAGHPELLRRDELKSMYMVLLNSDKRHYLQLKVQVLKNIACFLHVEEQKALRRAEQSKREREQRARQQREAEEDLLAAAIEAQEDLSAAPGGVNVLTPGAGVDDLKEMELSSSGLSSSIIQQYWTAILNCYFHNDEVVRVNAAQVVRQTLEQGLVTPGSSVPTLVAMSTDTLVNVRTRVEVLIRDMNTKYKGMILSKAIPGVRLSFQLQHKIRYDLSQAIRGIRSSENPLNSSAGPSAATTTAAASSSSSTDKKALSALPTYANDAQALLGNFYVCIRVNRQQRRSFLSSLLKLFSEDHKEKIDREEWVYVADNLAHFPYTVLDEPLYVIHQANSIISVSGQSILSQFRQLLLPSTGRGDGTRDQQQLQHQLQHVHLQQQQQQQSPQRPTTRRRYLDLSGRSSNASSMGSSGSSGALLPPEELEEFSVEYIIEHLPSDRTHILELKLNSQACFLLLHLKLFLLRMYGLKEDKIAEYTPSEAAAVYEKACSRRNIRCFAPDFVINELAAAAASAGEQQRNADDWAERRRIAEDFHKFHEMLLSLDERRDDDEDEAAAGPWASLWGAAFPSCCYSNRRDCC
uniref:Nipped-B protein n=1 Tax=Globodera pallida TaxID=36090 RepID=A0A183CFS0_GLOPA